MERILTKGLRAAIHQLFGVPDVPVLAPREDGSEHRYTSERDLAV